MDMTISTEEKEYLLPILLNSFSHVCIVIVKSFVVIFRSIFTPGEKYRVLITVKFFSDLPRLGGEKSLLCVTM